MLRASEKPDTGTSRFNSRALAESDVRSRTPSHRSATRTCRARHSSPPSFSWRSCTLAGRTRFIDTDDNEESFFVRHAYFLGANDLYKALKTTPEAEIDKEAWDTLNSDTSRPFPMPASGRIAVKVINHLSDEVMKVHRID